MAEYELQTPMAPQKRHLRSKSDRGDWQSVEQVTDYGIEDDDMGVRRPQTSFDGRSTMTGHQSLGGGSQRGLVDHKAPDMLPSRIRGPQGLRWDTIWAWSREGLACLVFLLALLAMVATAHYFNHRPLPHWPLNISINAVYSIFANIFEGALLYVVVSAICQTQWHWFARTRSLHDLVRFDDASRGAFGSFTWLVTKRLQQPLTAFAAVIGIFTVATDTFVQQLISYKDCSVILPGNATIPTTNFFNPIIAHIEAGVADYPDTTETTALISGLLSSPSDISFSCSSGNCTFTSLYSTLGYCSVCSDISEHLKFDMLSENCTNYEQCNITSTLPSGLSMDSIQTGNDVYSPYTNLVAASGTESGAYEILVGRTFYTERNIDPMVLNRTACENNSADSWSCRGYGAASCTFSPCIRTYNTSISAGRLNETLVGTSSADVVWSYEGINGTLVTTAAVLDTQCINSGEANDLRAAGYAWNSSTQYIQYNLTADPVPGSYGTWVESFPENAPFPESLLAHNCLYLLTPAFTTGFDQFFLNYSVFSGSLSATSQEGGTLAFFNGSQVMQEIYNSSYNSLESINSMFQDAATGFTNHMRLNGNANYSRAAQGMVHHYATCVNIHWVWISLPAALAACTLLLLSLIIIETIAFDAPLWKSSPLALVFHGPGGLGWLQRNRDSSFTGYAQDPLLHKQDMDDIARGIKVELQDGEQHLRLGRVEDHEVANSLGIAYHDRIS